MECRGRVHNGVVVLEDGVSLPEGVVVTVSWPEPADAEPAKPKRRVQFPLVHSKNPGTLKLTAERIAELLAEEDCAP